ncbi:MAG TPA: hypothetical protein VN426_14175 [Syntrophomonadaceae bacterium]|nr:hypothetical protein [Syntrophomonadaceae bacterium]
MSETNHAENGHATKKFANPNYKVPKIIPILIILVLAAMYYYPVYQDYRDFKSPETIVQKFFSQLFIDKDYQRAADKMSVFMASPMLPEYSTDTPAQLLKARREIIAKAGPALEQNFKNGEQEAFQVTPLPEYTKVGEQTAIVVGKVVAGGKDQGFGLTFLIKEDGKFRIIQYVPLPSAAALEEVKKIDMKTMDDQAKTLLNQS